ncbi:MAG: preprotein translocase subunit SecA [Ruminococcus sp.]|nr:preprotein translocase subunit SecA [Ruminococcus sp.]
MGFFKSFFEKRDIKRIDPICDKVLALEEKYANMSESELKAQTAILKERLQNGETTDDILPDAFAVCREASYRVLGMKHFRVQIIGGIVLHQGKIAEMKTGEGKTLVATLPAYLNGLTGRGVHIVTVNDYLAKRDSEWMGKLYRYLGLSVGLIVHGLDNEERRKAYAADITYGTNNELGFDYLRDNMVVYKEHKVQREHAFAIVDEVDSILIDEARTPLIISGKGEEASELYTKANALARSMRKHVFTEIDNKEDMEPFYKENGIDYVVDEKAHSATLTQIGVKKAEKFFGLDNLTDPDNLTIQHHINQAIKAYGCMKNEVNYVVKDGEVIIVDEFTGRLMYGRRYNEGLHQAIEAKEGVKVENESKTLATITFQNLFRLYEKLSGMTGTAVTEEEEFDYTYKLEVIVIPTNKEIARVDHPDALFKTERGKYMAIIEEIKEAHRKGQPVLVGTISIEKSEELSKMLKKSGIEHNVLNAKHHEKEAKIIAQAGKLGAVTIATNMAGRGTDIVLGGNAEYMAKSAMRKDGFDDEMIEEATSFAETDDKEILEARRTYTEYHEQFKAQIKEEARKVREAGGLYIIGTERHESRRIDNQLRGRSGRQGDPGKSRFFLSCEDDLMRIFGGDRMGMMLDRMNVEEDMPIENKMLSNIIESSQQKVESRNYAIRKNVLDYDNILNKQREKIYTQRNQVLDGADVHDNVINMVIGAIENNVNVYLGSDDMKESWNISGLNEYFRGWLINDDNKYSFKDDELEKVSKDDIIKELTDRALKIYEENEGLFDHDTIREMERVYLLKTVDTYWMEHIDNMEQLKQGIRLRAYGQRDPVIEYTFESDEMFNQMNETIKEETAKLMLVAPKRVLEIQRRQAEIERRQREMEERAAAAHQVILKNGEEKEKPNAISLSIKREQVAKPIEPMGDGTMSTNRTVVKRNKIGRNSPCPCGSGKKYKRCCGKDA